MTWQLTVASGKSNVAAPNGIRYAAGNTIILSDAEYSQLSLTAAASDFTSVSHTGDGVTYQVTLKSTVSNVVLPNGIRYGASSAVVLSDQEYAQLSLTAIASLFSSVTTL